MGADEREKDRIEAVRRMRETDPPMSFKQIGEVLGCTPQEAARLARLARETGEGKKTHAETMEAARKAGEEAGRKGARWALGCVLVLGALIGICVLVPLAENGSGGGRKIEAMGIARQYVEARLTSPATADWPFESALDVVRDLGNDRYKVSSYVDSQNAFGAVVRTRYICIVRHDAARGGWVLEDLRTQ